MPDLDPKKREWEDLSPREKEEFLGLLVALVCVVICMILVLVAAMGAWKKAEREKAKDEHKKIQVELRNTMRIQLP